MLFACHTCFSSKQAKDRVIIRSNMMKFGQATMRSDAISSYMLMYEIHVGSQWAWNFAVTTRRSSMA